MKRIDIISRLPSDGEWGVEVGVCQGHFSEEILSNWGGTLVSVDSWEHIPDRYQDLSNVSDEEHDKNYNETVERLRKFKKRSEIWRMRSAEAVWRFKDNSLMFVYLDAAHDFRSVWLDISNWFPKVKSGGIIAGHDYFNSGRHYRNNLVEVKRAVDQVFYDSGLTVNSTEERRLPSWWVEIP